MFGEYGKCLLQRRWRAIASTLTHEQDVLDVVFYDRPRPVGLPVKTSAIPIGFRYAVRDFVPENRCQAIQPKPAAPNLDIGGQGHHIVPTGFFSGDALIPVHAAYAAARREQAEAFRPHCIELV